MLNPLRHGSAPQNEAETGQQREWLARLKLRFARGETSGNTKLLENTHSGPLSVQRPFYPERGRGGHCCHVYLLHPPGGLVAGDSIDVDLQVGEHSHALLTTPSAGKIYQTDAARHLQRQALHTDIEDSACLEWLPQETIVFTGANACLHNHFRLQGSGKLIAWDIVCLGRLAGNKPFNSGRCEQLIEVECDGRLLLRERNIWPGGSTLMQAPWGMAGNTVSGTMIANTTVGRRILDTWRGHLAQLALPGEWGITQKPDMFIARYLGQSAQQCRTGFEFLWRNLRPLLTGYESCRPRIWNT